MENVISSVQINSYEELKADPILVEVNNLANQS